MVHQVTSHLAVCPLNIIMCRLAHSEKTSNRVFSLEVLGRLMYNMQGGQDEGEGEGAGVGETASIQEEGVGLSPEGSACTALSTVLGRRVSSAKLQPPSSRDSQREPKSMTASL